MKKGKSPAGARFLSFLLSGVLCVSILAGCNNSGKNASGKFEKTTSDGYPVKTGQKLRYWLPMSGHVSAHSASLNDTPFAKALIEQTGINVEFIHPPAGSEAEKFSLMMASSDVPDIVEYTWSNYTGGPEKAIQDGVICGLNDIIDAVSPNLKKIYAQHPEIEKQYRTMSGELYIYPFLVFDDVLATYIGPMVRKDLLDKAGLSAPETVADWDKMLRAFKSMGIETPLTLQINNKYLGSVSAFLGAFGIAGDYYIKDGRVKYGFYEPEFQQ
jgi:putative aldouronate transport system substrate-binding protein